MPASTSSSPPVLTPSVSPAHEQAGGCPATVAATICATIAFDDAVTLGGTGTAVAPQPPTGSPSSTCTDIAAAADGGNLGDHLEGIEGHDVAWDATIGGYHGPGHYDSQALQLTIDSDSYVAEDGAVVDITVDPDFATTIRFHNLQSTGDTPAQLAGTIAWTCNNPAS